VLPAYQLLASAHRNHCGTDAVAGTGWHLALDERADERLLPLPEPIVRVGRGAHCDLCIDHPTVSEDHAALAVRRTRLILFSLGASGRTFLNGRRVADRVELADYDVVLFGDAMVIVRRIDAPTADRSRRLPSISVV
jgi:pSer/pThr/pTyr-binding forkhead associated (FHA) protein